MAVFIFLGLTYSSLKSAACRKIPLGTLDHKEDINFKITKFIRELEKNVSGAQSEAASSELVLNDLQMEKAVLLLRECRHYLQK